MSAKPCTCRESDANRAMRLARKNGLKVLGLRVDHDGFTVLTEGAAVPTANPWDKKDETDAGAPPRAP
jgi:hypothetical protein